MSLKKIPWTRGAWLIACTCLLLIACGDDSDSGAAGSGNNAENGQDGSTDQGDGDQGGPDGEQGRDDAGTNSSNDDNDVSHEASFADTETGARFEIDGMPQTYVAKVANSLETQHVIDFNNHYGFPQATLYWIPQTTGTYRAGDNLGQGKGTLGNDLFITAFIKHNGETYYAHSAHSYGFLEEDAVEGSSCTIRITKHEGEYVTYEQSFGSFKMTITTFLGEIEGVFAGTFVSTSGERISVTKGEFRIHAELPSGATVLQ